MAGVPTHEGAQPMRWRQLSIGKLLCSCAFVYLCNCAFSVCVYFCVALHAVHSVPPGSAADGLAPGLDWEAASPTRIAQQPATIF